jgi:hypothetical protein
MARKKPPADPIAETQAEISTAIEGLGTLFVPNPSRRKGWENLSAGYRSRLERGGITEELYRRGRTLVKARGHTSTRREAEDKQYNKLLRDYINRQEEFYDKSEEEVRDGIAGLSKEQIRAIISHQKKEEALYDAGQRDEATAEWRARIQRYPDWLFYYHGAFS